MCTALLAFGHCTTDCEKLVLQAARALRTSAAYVSIGHRELKARFENGPAHLVPCGRDFVFSALSDVTSLAQAIAVGEVREVPTALWVLDRLLERPLPYGWLVFWLDFWWIGPWAAIGAYYGTYWDMLGALCISPVVILTMLGCKRAGISHLELFLVPLAVGIWTPLVWRYLSNGNQPICHVTPQYIGPLLIHLPGAQLVWGALEAVQGSVVHGTSRLVYGMLQAMLLAVMIDAGWQFWGQGFAECACADASLDESGKCEVLTRGVLANLPDTMWCAEPSFAGMERGTAGYLTWYFIVGVYNIPLNLLCLVNVHVRPRDLLGPFLTGQVGLVALAYLQFQCTDATCAMPAILQNIIAAFLATSVAMAVELVTFLPNAVCVIPVLFIFAPGSGAIMATMARIQRDAGAARKFVNSATLWESITTQAVTYMIGIYLAQELWTPVIRMRLQARAQTNATAAGKDSAAEAERLTEALRESVFTSPLIAGQRDTHYMGAQRYSLAEAQAEDSAARLPSVRAVP